jgi:hypothetical protein
VSFVLANLITRTESAIRDLRVEDRVQGLETIGALLPRSANMSRFAELARDRGRRGICVPAESSALRITWLARSSAACTD